MELVQDKDKRSGLIVTVVFHSILLLLFVFFGLTYMEPPPPEEGITINFGTSDDGSGDVQPIEPIAASEERTTEEQTPQDVPTPSEITEEVATQEAEVAPKINEKKKEQIVEKEEPKEEVKPTPSKNLNNALSKWKNNTNNKQSNEGETGKPGDQGSEDGDKNSNNRIGGGNGNGVTFNLSGRKMITSPRIKDDSQEEGKVVVDIVVDKYGNVVRAVPGGRGSTTTSPLLYQKAKEAALQSRFSAKSEGAIEQKGSITFIFILN